MDGAGLLESLYHCVYLFGEVREQLAKTGECLLSVLLVMAKPSLTTLSGRTESLAAKALLVFVQATAKTCAHITQVIRGADLYEVLCLHDFVRVVSANMA